MKIIKKGKKYSVVKENNKYFFLNEKKYVTTPKGNILYTEYLELAEKILIDLENYGEETMSAVSILPWHYTIIDFFSKIPHEYVETEIFVPFVHDDYSYHLNDSNVEMQRLLGTFEIRKYSLIVWLRKATIMQLTAICCIGNSIQTINIAFVLAYIIETFEGEKRKKCFTELLIYLVNNHEPFLSMETINNFEIYYGIHLKENKIKHATNLINFESRANSPEYVDKINKLFNGSADYDFLI